MIFIGFYISGMSLGIIPINIEKLNSPLWVLFLVGLVFFIGGIMLILGDKGGINDLLAGFLLVSMGSISGWIALFGKSENVSGGLFFLSGEINIMLFRYTFGFGAILIFMVSIYAFRRYIKRNN